MTVISVEILGGLIVQSTDPYKKSCNIKIRHRMLCKAIHHADRLMDLVTLMRHPECAYWCKEHHVYHVGSNKFMASEIRSVYEPAARARGRMMRLSGDDTDAFSRDPMVD